jgi:hypothetical protein
VPGGGIEPPQGFWPLRILSPLRLPISPSRLAIILAYAARRNSPLCGDAAPRCKGFGAMCDVPNCVTFEEYEKRNARSGLCAGCRTVCHCGRNRTLLAECLVEFICGESIAVEQLQQWIVAVFWRQVCPG